MRYQKEWAKLYIGPTRPVRLCGYEMDIDTGWHDHHSNIEPMAVPMPLAIASCFILTVTREFTALV